jgi:hypothetical protein
LIRRQNMRSKKAPHTPAVDQTVLSRRSFLKEMGFASLGCTFFLSPWNFLGLNILKGSGKRLGTIKERKTMKLAQHSPVPHRVIPPIDAAAPAKTETATFAMG